MTAPARPPGSIAHRSGVISVTRRLGARADRVFGAWLDAALAPRWLFATATCPIARAVMNPRPFGKFDFVEIGRGRTRHYRGRYLRIEPVRRISFELECAHEWPVPSQVDVVIRETDGISHLQILHRRLPADSTRYWRSRWIGMLYGLGTLLAPRGQAGKDHGSGRPG